MLPEIHTGLTYQVRPTLRYISPVLRANGRMGWWLVVRFLFIRLSLAGYHHAR